MSWKQVLVPVDFSDSSRMAVRYAVEVAEAGRGSIVLIYVDETASDGANRSGEPLPSAPARRLATFRRREVPKGLRCICIVRRGRADVEVVKAAEELTPDLIVLPVHGHCSQQGQLGRTVLRVASMSPCPVLLVPVCKRALPFFI